MHSVQVSGWGSAWGGSEWRGQCGVGVTGLQWEAGGWLCTLCEREWVWGEHSGMSGRGRHVPASRWESQGLSGQVGGSERG